MRTVAVQHSALSVSDATQQKTQPSEEGRQQAVGVAPVEGSGCAAVESAERKEGRIQRGMYA